MVKINIQCQSLYQNISRENIFISCLLKSRLNVYINIGDDYKIDGNVYYENVYILEKF